MDLIFTIAFILICILVISSIAFVGSILFILLYSLALFLIVTCWVWIPLTIVGYFVVKLIRSK